MNQQQSLTKMLDQLEDILIRVERSEAANWRDVLAALRAAYTLTREQVQAHDTKIRRRFVKIGDSYLNPEEITSIKSPMFMFEGAEVTMTSGEKLIYDDLTPQEVINLIKEAP